VYATGGVYTRAVNVSLRHYMLLHAHPAKLGVELAGSLAAARCLCRHDWRGAAAASASAFLGSTVALWGAPVDSRSRTALGRAMLAYATPGGFALYNLSALPLVHGLWTHRKEGPSSAAWRCWRCPTSGLAAGAADAGGSWRVTRMTVIPSPSPALAGEGSKSRPRGEYWVVNYFDNARSKTSISCGRSSLAVRQTSPMSMPR
jgi:hypothetical protein